MEKRIELERRARKANQITDLNLDNCRSTSIVGLSDEYTALEALSLINVGLTTLKGFPKLPNLKKLELSDNRISNGLNYLTTSPKLQYLNLSGNKIKDLETLKPLQEFKNLAVLDLFNNEATQISTYREKIFEMLPSLKFLDGFDCNDVEAPSECDDDDDVNGNDSDEDDERNVFCLNGLEIDLDELEEFEKRVQAKKQSSMSATKPTSITGGVETSQAINTTINDETDDLDTYLKELQIKEKVFSESNPNLNSAQRTTTTTSIVKSPRAASSMAATMNFGILLYWFLAILNLASAACYSDAMGEEDEDEGDEDDDGDEDSDGEDNGDVSLSEVYNDDLEEDNSEWDEGDAPGDDDDDDDSDEDEADGEANESATAKAAPKGADAEAAAGDKDVADAGEEPQARGKKRKHDG